jgi:hypothetical protein
MCSDIPEEDGLVAAYTDESVVVLGDAQVVDFVAMSAVFLDFETGGGIEEANVAIGAAGQELDGRVVRPCSRRSTLLGRTYWPVPAL